MAIDTGWDCPRAKILIKLREGGTERFNIQTVGRIRRMPERKHYDNEVLDNCYLYTLDSEFKESYNVSRVIKMMLLDEFSRNNPDFDFEKNFKKGKELQELINEARRLETNDAKLAFKYRLSIFSFPTKPLFLPSFYCRLPY